MNTLNREQHFKLYEKLIKRDKIMSFISGVIFILIGAYTVLQYVIKEIADLTIPTWTNGLVSILFICVLIIFVLQSRNIFFKRVTPQDELEIQENSQAKAKAYTFLANGLLISILLASSSMEIFLGCVFMILGGAWILLAKHGGRVDA